jgi:hypothetical protein
MSERQSALSAPRRGSTEARETYAWCGVRLEKRAKRKRASSECRDDGGPAACKDLAPVPGTRHNRGVRRLGHDDGNPQLEVVVRA